VVTSQRINLPRSSTLAAAEPRPARGWADLSPADADACLSEPSLAATIRLAGAVAGTLAAACVVIALTVHVALAATARDWLVFPFTGIPPRPTIAGRIFVHNLRALAAVWGLLLIAQSALWQAGIPGPASRILRRSGEMLLGAAVAANLIVVGASLGAYGTRMLRATLPHGPFELAAYSLALSLYLQGRRRSLPLRLALPVAALSIAALATAAVLETYVNV
jgi:hypothetical protein